MLFLQPFLLNNLRKAFPPTRLDKLSKTLIPISFAEIEAPLVDILHVLGIIVQNTSPFSHLCQNCLRMLLAKPAQVSTRPVLTIYQAAHNPQTPVFKTLIGEKVTATDNLPCKDSGQYNDSNGYRTGK
ncbi:hypothetical protein HCH_02089 [Hahella chejuensis KCTC 2396]|uniref:Uncharacterized protein n=1 Tax=Hahella chejuensis (strain KCTC 2396) TaxID=349521 RepID=Q2SKA5_HAHCH|nr:hypothetical protein HCH_02089 [Hahella chejuensis KCTC 2396]